MKRFNVTRNGYRRNWSNFIWVQFQCLRHWQTGKCVLLGKDSLISPFETFLAQAFGPYGPLELLSSVRPNKTPFSSECETPNTIFSVVIDCIDQRIRLETDGFIYPWISTNNRSNFVGLPRRFGCD